MLLKAAINGRRTRNEHPAVPLTPQQQAQQSALAVAMGAGAIHVHPRDTHGRESLAPDEMAAAAWAFIELAARRGCYDTRVGLEDTLVLPDGTRARDNAELVAAARCIVDRQKP